MKARVCLLSEEVIEQQLLGEIKELPQEAKYLVWRDVSQPVSEIKRILQYDREKSVILTWEGDSLLVKGRHEDLHKEWKELMKEGQAAFEEELYLGATDETKNE